MNDHDDILNGIVGEFFDGNKLFLSEISTYADKEKINKVQTKLYDYINNSSFDSLPGTKELLTKKIEELLKIDGIENVIPTSKESRIRYFKKYGMVDYLLSNLVDGDKIVYVKYIFSVSPYNVVKVNQHSYYGYFKKYPEFLKQIIDGKNVTLNKDEKKKFYKYYSHLLLGELPYIYSSRSDYKLTDDQISLVNQYIETKYEQSFLTKGYRKPTSEERPNESRIHNLEDGYLTNSIINSVNKDELDGIIDYIKKNIENYIISDEEIHKYDLIAKRDFGDIIKTGDKIEVKDIKYSDSYLAEPLASPVKMSGDRIRKNKELLNKYNYIIDNLYEWLKEGGTGESIGNSIINKMVAGLKGFFIHDNIFVPIENFKFYISNVGQNNPKKHRRLAIRYHIGKDAITYQLQDDGKKEGKRYYFKKLSPKNNGIEYIDKKVYNNLDYISEYVNKLLDL